MLKYENLLILPSDVDAPVNKGIKKEKVSEVAGIPFSFAVDIRITTLPRTVARTSIPVVNLELSSCTTSYSLQISLNTDDQRDSAASVASQTSQSQSDRSWQKNFKDMNRLYLPFVLICTTVGLFYLILLLIYGIVRAYTSSTSPRHVACSCKCAKTSPNSNGKEKCPMPKEYTNNTNQRRLPSTSISSATSLLSTPHDGSLTTTPMTTTRKMLLMFYLCFRVFYTFLFTISVAVSFVLSIESNAAREFTMAINSPGSHSARNAAKVFSSGAPNALPNAYVIIPLDLENRWRGAKSWMFEAARMEDFAQSELLRQVSSVEYCNVFTI